MQIIYKRYCHNTSENAWEIMQQDS